MPKTEYAAPPYATASDLKRVRRLLGLTQKEFAALVGVSKPTIERWEAGSDKIHGPVVLLLQMLERDPEYIRSIRIPPREYPLRLRYMYKDRLCTIIDVDERRQLVRIANYTDKLLFRAFGVNRNPTYQEYQEFLESRCFPKTRDKLKLVLKDLDLPFYDPLLIVEKTQGRMAEDDFWLSLER